MIETDELDDVNENDDLYEHYRFVADKGQSLLRIDKFLFNRIENASRTKIAQAADNGNVLVNNQVVKSNYRVKPSDVITIVMAYPPREIEIIPEDIPLQIVYEDEDLVVVNKKAGMVVHPGYGNYTGTLVNALSWHFKDLPMFQTGDLRPGLVHRIDKNTSGILIVAKTIEAKNNLAMQFFTRTTDRKYHALVWGSFEEETGTITGNIGRSLKNRKVMDIFPNGDFGKHAVTHYKVLERGKIFNLLHQFIWWNANWKPEEHTRFGLIFNILGTPFSMMKLMVATRFLKAPPLLNTSNSSITHSKCFPDKPCTQNLLDLRTP